MIRIRPGNKLAVWLVAGLFSFWLLLPVGKCGPGCPDCKKDCQKAQVQQAQENLPPCHRAMAVQTKSAPTNLPQPCCLKSGQKPIPLPQANFSNASKLALFSDLPSLDNSPNLNYFAPICALGFSHLKLKAPPPLYILNSALLI